MPTKKEISKKAYTILGKKLYFTQDCLRTKYWCWQNLREQSTYEDNVLKLVLHELSSSSIFVDIGAHFGFYTIPTAKTLSKGEVYAFEMDKFNFQILKKNLLLNDIQNVHPYKIAIADYSGQAKYRNPLKLFKTMSTHITSEVPSNNSKGKNLTQVTTLNNFFQNKKRIPDIIKMDIEGAEIKALKGMENFLTNSSSLTLFLEIHPKKLKRLFNSSVKAVFNILKQYPLQMFIIENFRKNGSPVTLEEITPKTKITENEMLLIRKE